MKTNIIVLILFLITCISCEKENTYSNIPAVQQPPPQSKLTAIAGSDLTLILPINSTELKASSNYAQTYSWKKISGPTLYTIDEPNSKTINVTNLEKGTYEFELTVAAGEVLAKDTVSVYICDPNDPYEIIFKNLKWISPWYNSVEVERITSYLSGNLNIKVYIQRDSNPVWIEVPNFSEEYKKREYEYFIETRPFGAGMYTYGSLYIIYYGTDISDSPQVKIVL